MNDEPILCTLPADGLRERLVEIADLNAGALVASHRDGRTLTLTYRRDAVAAVETMVAKERECCAFLTFRIDVRADRVDLHIAAPEGAGEGAKELLNRFAMVAADTEQRACGCAGECGPSAPPARSGARPAGAAALTASTAALACSACCVLPLALPAAALAATGGTLAIFAAAARWLVPISALVVAAGWWWVWREARRSGLPPSRATKVMMGIASVMLLLSLAWPLLEARMIALLAR